MRVGHPESRAGLATVRGWNRGRTAAVVNAIIVQLSRIMSVILTGNVWSVSPRVMCGDDYAIICWREVMVKRLAVRRREINTPSPSSVSLACK